MNSTWIISPNWLAWGLLAVIAVSLVITAWAICKIFALHAIKEKESDNKGLFSIPPFYKGMIWVIAAIEILIVCILGYIIFKKVDMSDGDVGGVYMSFFSALITFLVGWQIYNTIVSREQIRDLNDNILDRTKRVLSVNLYHVFSTQGANEHKRKDYSSALNYYFRCVDCAINGDLKNELNLIIEKIKNILSEPQAKVGVNDCTMYCNIIMVTKHIDADFIMKKLQEIKSPEAIELGSQWLSSSTLKL